MVCPGASSFPIPFAAPPTLQETRSLLSSLEKSFLDALDGELDKIETFYLDREKEMTARAQLLHEQLHELTHHRKLFHVSYTSFNHLLPFIILQEAQERSIRVDKFLGIRKTSKSPLKKRKAKSQKDQDDDAKFGYLDPEEYQNAKKKLKKAVVEHYRLVLYLYNPPPCSRSTVVSKHCTIIVSVISPELYIVILRFPRFST